MKKRFFSLFLTFLLIITFCACGKNDRNKTDGKSEIESTTVINSQGSSTENTMPVNSVISEENTQIETFTDSVIVTVAPVTPTTKPTPNIQQTTAPQTESTTKVYEKTGDMAFSDDAENKYIKAVTDKYKINPENVVVLYTVPDNDGNLVLEFDGSADNTGKKIRNKDTLVAIYSIDRNLNSKCASEDKTKNEYSYGEMKVIYFSTTTYIMPEFADKL